MYYFLSLVVGVLISITVLMNGELSALYGLYASSVMIHIVGLVLISATVVAKRENPFAGGIKWYWYIGGAIGLVTLVFTNFAFGRISVSAILALGLLGQSVASLFVDRYGLLGMPRHPFDKRKLIGTAIVFLGIASMVDNFHFLAVALSFAAGITAVVSRSLNAKLSDWTSVWVGTFYNYFAGLAAAFLVFLLLGGNDAIHQGFVLSPDWYIYCGGILGVVLIAISNLVVTKISAFYVSLFLFVGQVFTGILIDRFVLGEFSMRILVGGVLVAIGMGVDLWVSRQRAYRR